MYQYLEDNLSGDKKILKESQIEAAISAGYDEIMKMSNLFFAPPVVFLILVDPCRRCSFCRALLTFIQHNTEASFLSC